MIKFDKMFQKMDKPEPVRPLSHAFFAALNGVLITFRNYPGRSAKAVRQHMLKIAGIIAGVSAIFNEGCGCRSGKAWNDVD